ncbi:MAG: DUF2752 domain-containing protein, partial [Polyangiaceae bacterium]
MGSRDKEEGRSPPASGLSVLQSPSGSTPSTLRRLLWLAFWAAPPAVAAFGISVCPSALILGTSCPGCGLTRALTLLVAGDVAGSYARHPVGWLVA